MSPRHNTMTIVKKFSLSSPYGVVEGELYKHYSPEDISVVLRYGTWTTISYI